VNPFASPSQTLRISSGLRLRASAQGFGSGLQLRASAQGFSSGLRLRASAQGFSSGLRLRTTSERLILSFCPLSCHSEGA